MITPLLVHEGPADDPERVNLEALDTFLASDRVPREAMTLSELDGFLTGIAAGPELVLPSEWLPLVWGRESAPEFKSEDEATAIVGAIMSRYNEIALQVADGTFDPILWIDVDGMPLPFDWAEGFLQAIALRADAWERLFKSKRDGVLLVPILALCGDEYGDSMLGLPREDEEAFADDAFEFIPSCVAGIAAFWRRKGPRQISMPLMPPRPAPTSRPAGKTGRNEPCPCGSGRKFKKCCGKDPRA